MNSHTHTHTAEWPIAKKLNYVRGKLSLIPAFGDGIGKEVNKAELGLCMAMIASAEASHADLLAALEQVYAQLGGHHSFDVSDLRLKVVKTAIAKAKGTT